MLAVIAFIGWLGALSPSAVAGSLLVVTFALVISLMVSRRAAVANLWDQTMLGSGSLHRWYTNLWLWWAALAAILVGIYVRFW